MSYSSIVNFFKNGLYTKLIANQVDEFGNLKLNEESQENTFQQDLYRRRNSGIYHKMTKKKRRSVSGMRNQKQQKIAAIVCVIIVIAMVLTTIVPAVMM